jgi:hypothetical protein
MLVTGPDPRSGGTYEASVALPYNHPGLMNHVLSNRLTDVPAKLWKTYFYDDAYLDPALLMDAVVSDMFVSKSSGDSLAQVTFTMISRGNWGGVTPYIRIAKPLLNHITPAGTVIVWGEQTVGIDR